MEKVKKPLNFVNFGNQGLRHQCKPLNSILTSNSDLQY